jgi:outer membrane biosynthesis protein TonB
LSDRLATAGPEAPGIVQPESQPGHGHPSQLQAAVLIQRVPPAYPKAAVDAHVTGEVRINATIDRDGVPRQLKVISGDLRLVEAAPSYRIRRALLSLRSLTSSS